MVNAAIIGVSGFGEVHYKDLIGQQEKGNYRICCAAIINQDEEKEKCSKLRSLNCEIFTDYREMFSRFKGRIDICFIPTGIHLHAPMTIAALEAGMNVFVEKPVAATVQELDSMKKAEEKSGKFVAVGYQTIYASETEFMKKKILAGAIGKIKSVKCRGLWPRTEAYYSRNNWAGRLKTGDNWVLDSPFNNALSHQLNMICFFAGKKFEESAKLASIEAELYRANKIESADTVCMRVLTEDNIPLYFIATHASDSTFGPEMIVTGYKGKIIWNFEKTILQAEGAVEQMPCEQWDSLRNSIMTKLMRKLSNPSEFVCSLDIAGTQTICVNGAHDSSEIKSFDKSIIRREAFENSFRSVVEGLDEAVNQSFEKEKLFSELAVPWAVKGKKISLLNYARFPSA